MPEELCYLLQKCATKEQLELMVQPLKEKYFKELKNTRKNVMNASWMTMESVYVCLHTIYFLFGDSLLPFLLKLLCIL